MRVPHPQFGELAMQNVFPRLSETPGRVRHAGPELGEHNDDVYRGLLGMSDDELEGLRSDGVV